MLNDRAAWGLLKFMFSPRCDLHGCESSIFGQLRSNWVTAGSPNRKFLEQLLTARSQACDCFFPSLRLLLLLLTPPVTVSSTSHPVHCFFTRSTALPSMFSPGASKSFQDS